MAKRTKKPKGPKEVHYEVIPRESVLGEPMYDLLDRLLTDHHDDRDLGHVRIALAWCTSWKADVDGRLILGKCKKATDLDRELAPVDFIILLNKDFWQDPRVSDGQRAALLDHEIMHAAVKYDDSGEPVVDERGRTVYRTRKHDLEEFADIVARHGVWKGDIEAFALALEHARSLKRDWVGYSLLQEQLEAVGAHVPLEAIRKWGEDERREAAIWAGVELEIKARGTKGISAVKPEHVAAAEAVHA